VGEPWRRTGGAVEEIKTEETERGGTAGAGGGFVGEPWRRTGGAVEEIKTEERPREAD
jgi:hypothetical protein